jgi:hypothetical protein
MYDLAMASLPAILTPLPLPPDHDRRRGHAVHGIDLSSAAEDRAHGIVVIMTIGTASSTAASGALMKYHFAFPCNADEHQVYQRRKPEYADSISSIS